MIASEPARAVSAMMRLFVLLFVLLAGLRLPALVQPAGADQGLYAYVGQRILEGGLPYRDAWDQKPPGVHYAYAAMYGLWPDAAVIGATDLLVAVLTALALVALGRRLAGGRGAGEVAALIFLLLSNPAFTRLGGVRVRGQSEIFIGLAITLAFLALWAGCQTRRDGHPARRGWVALAGALVGIAFLFKYNAAAYGLAMLVGALVLGGDVRTSTGERFLARAWPLAAGFLVPVAVLVAGFAAGGALEDLYHATITYNLFYSGETYGGWLAFVTYLFTFPVRHAWLDSFWWLGGLGAAALALGSVRDPARLVVPAWVAAACLSIAINGGRGLPQYFVQAGPALALAAGLLLAGAWRHAGPLGRAILCALVAVGLWRVTPFDKAFETTRHDLRMTLGQVSRDDYLARFGDLDAGDKYSALAMKQLADHLRSATRPDDHVLLFGFSPDALVQARRLSATRFFWSRPVIVGFEAGRAGYGVEGLLAELEATRPPVVVLQARDWDPDGPDSLTYFLGEPRLAGWLGEHYAPAPALGQFKLWTRRVEAGP